MKRIIALLCLLALCLPLCACGSSLEPTEEAKTAEETKTVEKADEKEEEEGEFTYPEGFSVGYGIVDISGPLPVDVWDGEAEILRDPLMLTCVAVCDGENVALLMASDTRGISRSAFENCAKIIKREFNIPRENILINTTHSHSAPSIGENDRWMINFYKQLPLVVEEALRDLTPAKAFAGKSFTEDLSFVRRYLLADGTYKTNASSSLNPVAHESEPDEELRTVRFEREGKKDVLMVNWQAHYMGAVKKSELSADMFGEFRKSAEKEFDCLYAYYSGSGGNLNCNSAIKGERKYFTFEEAAVEFTRATSEALKVETEVATGKVVCKTSVYSGTVRRDTPELIAKAKEITDAGRDTPEGKALLAKYGFDTKYAATAVITRSNLPDKVDMNFFAVSFGDIAFTTAPFEQFDTNGKEVRDASPFPVTFTLSITNESNGYVPSALAYPHPSYEVDISRFIPGSGEEFAREQLRLLNECKAAY